MPANRANIGWYLDNMVAASVGVAIPHVIHKSEDGITLCYGITKPVDDATGYAKGCLWIHTDGSEGDMLYVNEGDADDCNFDAVLVTTDDVITLAMMAANSVDSDQYVDGSVDRAHLAADIVNGTKIADDAIDSEHYTAASIDNEHLADDCVNSAECDESLIQTATHEITNGEVLTMYSDNTNKGHLLLAAPGSGKMIECISCVLKLNYTGPAFSHYATCNLNVGTNQIGSIPRTFLEAGADTTVYRTYDYDLVVSTAYENQPLYLQAKTLNPTTGGGNISVRLSYRILDFS